ncbi:hypothetical protein CDD82_5107 [Ophiocordyceps australis]|uniref:Uncharacterized protein n=1 Tax=Ophiocordyceps australis TaxID=1399860 RepID=A0A2C5YZ91_9HYPO|nr:hypothetical protein CDD82_5107 [Ophiocordyceps australis]
MAVSDSNTTPQTRPQQTTTILDQQETSSPNLNTLPPLPPSPSQSSDCESQDETPPKMAPSFSSTISFKNYCALVLVIRKEMQDALRKAGEYGQVLNDTERELHQLNKQRAHVLFTRPKRLDHDAEMLTLNMDIGVVETKMREAERERQKWLDKYADSRRSMETTEAKLLEHYPKEWKATGGLVKKYEVKK